MIKKSLLIASALVATYTATAAPLAANTLITNPAFLEQTDVQRMVNFLTTDVNSGTSGAAYTATAGDLNGKMLPLSFWSTPQFFGDYICVHGPTADGSAPDCNVVDRFKPSNSGFEISPDIGIGGDLQLERLNTKHGMNIYDSSCWQIALAMLAGKDQANYGALLEHAENVNLMLRVSYTGDDTGQPPVPLSWRGATKDDGTFAYNGVSIPMVATAASPLSGVNAYAFRMWPRQWKSMDIFTGTQYESYVKTADFPVDGSIPLGSITWHDYKPITGENAWAFFVGPVHSAYFRDIVVGGKPAVDFNSQAIQTAIKVLPAVCAMQSSTGGVFYITSGTLGNTGNTTVNPYSLSTENNASLFAGMVMLRQLLLDVQTHAPPTDPLQVADLEYALFNLKTILEGGQSAVSQKPTAGMFSFFKNNAWNATTGVFGTGGFADDPARGVTFDPYVFNASDPSTAQAVDVNTWTIAALGAPYVDKVIANQIGASFKAWNSVKSFGGFKRADGGLCGVGYSEVDQNDILSGEWTFGAINLVRVLREQYAAMQTDPQLTPVEQQAIPAMLTELEADEKAMLECVKELQTDRYGSSELLAAHRPPMDYNSLVGMKEDQMAYLYASKRYFIPFGWFANPLPSTTSTAWAIMLQYGFNPFVLGGQYASSIPGDRSATV